MCGIAGIIGASRVKEKSVVDMTELMVHRGPDASGFWTSKNGLVSLGHRRLSIIDLSDRAAQPMTDKDGRLTLTYNGEIYNFVELRNRLQQHGCIFTSNSDTEVVLQSYRIWGEDCVNEFNGMFAFAIYDSLKNIVFCARDRYGEKPFLYTTGPKFFAFASEYKPLLRLDGVSQKINDLKLIKFFANPSNGLDQTSDTVFPSIKQLLPGEQLTLQVADLRLKKTTYWSPPIEFGKRQISQANAIYEFRELLEDCIKIRMQSDVPLGSCLSGGLDSSAITCIAQKFAHKEQQYNVFVGRFPGSKRDEGNWANLVVAETGVCSHEAFPKADKLIKELEDFIWLNELPVDSASQFCQWSIFKLAKEHNVTVLLDGQGSDEILGGYEQYFPIYLSSLRADGVDTRETEILIRERYPLAFSESDQSWKNLAPLFFRKWIARTIGRGSNILYGTKNNSFANVKTEEEQHVDLHRSLRADSFKGFLTTLLRYGDRNSMAHSREVRLPFCDYRIAEFVLALPTDYIMAQAQTKFLLRESMQGIVPEKIRTRWGKQGFLPPIADWLAGDLGQLLEELFLSQSFQTNPHWAPDWWQGIFRRFKAGESQLSDPLWKVLVSELWRKTFFEKLASVKSSSPLA